MRPEMVLPLMSLKMRAIAKFKGGSLGMQVIQSVFQQPCAASLKIRGMIQL
jgi:hypothetical protein